MRLPLLTALTLAGCFDLGDNDSALPLPDVPEPPPAPAGPIELGEIGCTVPAPIADLLRRRCGPGCHTGGTKSGDVDLDPERVLGDPSILPGDPDKSLALEAVAAGTMPPGPPLSAEEVKALREWVAGLNCLEGTGEGEAVGLPRGCTGVLDRVDCNPLTSAECTVPGYSCDFNLTYGLVCQPPPNDVPPGAACNNLAGPFCTPGHHCAPDGVCRAFCCNSGDCEPGQRCEAARPDHGSLGTCRD